MRYFGLLIVRSSLFILIATAAISHPLRAALVEYDIDIDYQTVNMTGRPVQAMTIGGSIPAQVIEAAEGDTLRVTFHNKMDVDTSVHWHGILLPNNQDGVPYLTTPPIPAHGSFTYEYPVIQSGTYWYHSHTGLQEQRGLYGALIFRPRERKYDYRSEKIIVFSDWTDEEPQEVLRHLKSDGDYYAFKKGSVQSWDQVLRRGWPAIRSRVKSSWERMGPMDLSDVGYDEFLVNGAPETEFGPIEVGDKVLLRLINASASTYFDVQFAGGRMEVVAADGVDVTPVQTDVLRMAVAETYDVIVTLPDKKSYELRATAMDGSGYASGFLGEGERVLAPDRPRPDLYIMDHSSHGGADPHAHHAHAGHMTGPKMLSYDDLKSPTNTELPAGNTVREILLRLTGNMERYIWSFNDKKLEETDVIRIRKGENVRFILKNETMMNHPLHLHGHFFRVINKQGSYSPLKHTVDIKPFETVTIEFLADQEKDWLFHCHILYHMMSGMSRIVQYEGSVVDPEIAMLRKHRKVHDEHPHWYTWGNISIQSNLIDGFMRATDDKNQIEFEWDNNYEGEYDIEPKYLYNVSRFLDIFVGGEFTRDPHDETEDLGTWGVRYVLPLLVTAEYRMDHRGSHKLGFETELQLTDRLEFHAHYALEWELHEEWDYSDHEFKQEYRIELEYALNKDWKIVANHDSDHQGGIGIRRYF